MTDLGPDQGAARLQEVGYAAGEQLYQQFRAWLPGQTGVDDPSDLDAETLGEVLGAFFSQLGWGPVELERLGARGLALSSEAWAESSPDEAVQYPSCYVTTGMLASFLTAMAGGHALAAMEVECRSQGDPRCRFLAGSPETLEAVYEAAAAGRDFESVIRG
ncbi:MAG: hypothetical protein PVF27_02430 [Gemmatimonadales bacterium]